MIDIYETALAQQNVYRAAMSNHPAQRRLDAILHAYDRVRNDPNVKLPTILMCALESARA